MPIYNFKIANEPAIDGVELSGITAARNVAVKFAAAMLRDQADALWKSQDWRLDVADQRSVTLFTIVVTAIEAPASVSASIIGIPSPV